MVRSHRSLVLCSVAALAISLVGCASDSRDHRATRETVAKATQRLKPEIQWTGEKLGQAARWTAEEAVAAVEGFFEGWSRGETTVDLNSASLGQLESLPGITRADAKQMIEKRPYRRTDELVTKGVLPRAEYRRIRDQVEVKS